MKFRTTLVSAFVSFSLLLGATGAVAASTIHSGAASSPFPNGVFVAKVSDMGSGFNGTWKLIITRADVGPNGNFTLDRVGDKNYALLYGGKMLFPDASTMRLIYGRGPLSCTQNKEIGSYSFSLTGTPQTLTMQTLSDQCAGKLGVILTTHTFARPTATPPTVSCGAFSVATHTWVARAKKVPCPAAKKIVRRLATHRLSGSNHRFPGTYPYPGGVLTKCLAVKIRAHKAVQILCTGANGARVNAAEKK